MVVHDYFIPNFSLELNLVLFLFPLTCVGRLCVVFSPSKNIFTARKTKSDFDGVETDIWGNLKKKSFHLEKTETYHFVIFFFFVFFSTFFSLSGIRTHILLFTLPLALVRSDAVAAAVAVLVPPVAAAHRHLLFFYYHLPKSILRLC